MKSLLFLGLILALPAQQPPAIVIAERAIVLSVTATGTNLKYQWYRNGTKINGQTTPTLTITATTATGTYTCVVSNSAGQVTSPSIRLANTSQADAPTITITRKTP